MVCAGASSVTIASIGDAATGAVCTAECGEEFLELELSVEKAITIMSWCSVESTRPRGSAFVLHFINSAVKTTHKVIGIL